MKSIQNKRVESIYLLKSISSFFVVAVHSSVWGENFFSSLFGLGTLCFLSITGWLLYSEDRERVQTKCVKWARKLFRLSIIVTIVYLVVLAFIGAMYSLKDTNILYYSFITRDSLSVAMAHGMWWDYLLVYLKDLLMSLVLGSGVCTTLWYLTAVWQGLLIFYVIIRYIPKLIYLLPFLFIFVYLLRSHPLLIFPTSPQLALICRLSVITALPILATGYLIHKHEEWLQKIVRVEIWLPVVFIALLVETQIRIHIFDTHGRYNFFTYPLLVLLLLTCTRYRHISIPFFNNVGENHSANIYYFHMIILFILMALKIKIPYIEAIVVWLTCIPISVAFNKIMSFFHK